LPIPFQKIAAILNFFLAIYRDLSRQEATLGAFFKTVKWKKVLS
jgi:hypothetical protein